MLRTIAIKIRIVTTISKALKPDERFTEGICAETCGTDGNSKSFKITALDSSVVVSHELGHVVGKTFNYPVHLENEFAKRFQRVAEDVDELYKAEVNAHI
jgi:hypothetical protein